MTLQGNENALVGVAYAVMGGEFILQHRNDTPASNMLLDVVNDTGVVIGYAHRIYSDGWAVQTAPFAGYVPDEQIIILQEIIQ